MTTPDIFLSYNREDQAVARRYADAFAAEGLNVWWDTALRSGEAYDEVTEAALRGAKAVVVLWSPRSVVSRWVRAEATIADRCKTLVPVTIEACERPVMFELTQTADLTRWTGDAEDPVWRNLLSDIMRRLGGDVAATAPAGLSPANAVRTRPSIAVMPFANLSGDPNQAYFVDGLMEEIVAALTRIPSIFVIASGSTMSFKGQDIGAVDAGKKLGVRYVLEGSVRKAGERVRIAVKLIDASDGAQIWAGRFDGDLADIFALQDDVALNVAGKLESSVMSAEVRRSVRRPTSDLRSYDLFLQALVKMRTFQRDHVFEALSMLERAIELDPTYAPALSLAASAHTMIMQYQWTEDPAASRAKVVDLIERSVRYGSDDAHVLTNAAAANWLSGRIAAGEPLAIRALELNPGSAWSLTLRGWYAFATGDLDLADQCLTDSMRLDPISPNRVSQLGGLAATRFADRRYEEALHYSVEENQLTQTPLSLGMLTAIHGQLGHAIEAGQTLAKLRKVTPMSGGALAETFYQTPEHRALFLEGFAAAEAAQAEETT